MTQKENPLTVDDLRQVSGFKKDSPLARALGIARGTWSSWRSNDGRVPDERYEQLAERFGVSVERLLAAVASGEKLPLRGAPKAKPNGRDATQLTRGSAAGTNITFHAGYHFDGLDASEIVRNGKPENVDRFLAWLRDMARDAQEAAKEVARASPPPSTEPAPPAGGGPATRNPDVGKLA